MNKKAYLSGKLAFTSNRPLAANPYRDPVARGNAYWWARGWVAALGQLRF